MTKIILIDELDNEHLVATFKTEIEAQMSASLLQALLLPDSKKHYRVITKTKQGVYSISPNSLSSYVGNIHQLYTSLRSVYLSCIY